MRCCRLRCQRSEYISIGLAVALSVPLCNPCKNGEAMSLFVYAGSAQFAMIAHDSSSSPWQPMTVF